MRFLQSAGTSLLDFFNLVLSIFILCPCRLVGRRQYHYFEAKPWLFFYGISQRKYRSESKVSMNIFISLMLRQQDKIHKSLTRKSCNTLFLLGKPVTTICLENFLSFTIWRLKQLLHRWKVANSCIMKKFNWIFTMLALLRWQGWALVPWGQLKLRRKLVKVSPVSVPWP